MQDDWHLRELSGMEDEQEGSEAEGSRGKAGESLKPQASQVGSRRKQGCGLEKG